MASRRFLPEAASDQDVLALLRMTSSGITPRCRLIALTGFMGCGKTTVGRLLARHLAWRFVDLDTRIEESAGLSITQIFDRLGEAAFRQIEREQLRAALGEVFEQDKPTVLALGGGTFAQPGNVELLRSFCKRGDSAAGGTPDFHAAGVVVWIECPLDELLARCVTMADRPMFRDESSFRQLYLDRLPFYQQADFRVASQADPRRVVEQILTLGIVETRLEAVVPPASVVDPTRKNDPGKASA